MVEEQRRLLGTEEEGATLPEECTHEDSAALPEQGTDEAHAAVLEEDPRRMKNQFQCNSSCCLRCGLHWKTLNGTNVHDVEYWTKQSWECLGAVV